MNNNEIYCHRVDYIITKKKFTVLIKSLVNARRQINNTYIWAIYELDVTILRVH